jgi:hypothetical protein
MSSVKSEFALAHHEDVYQSSGVLFIAFERVGDLIDEAERNEIGVLGFDGFLVDGTAVYPSISRLSDYSDLPKNETWRRAREDLAGEWRFPPTIEDQMHPEAKGRYMIDVTLSEP